MTFLLDALSFLVPVALIALGSLLRRRVLLDPAVTARNDAKNIALYHLAYPAKLVGGTALIMSVFALSGGVAASLLVGLMLVGIVLDGAAADRSGSRPSWTPPVAIKKLSLIVFASDLRQAALIATFAAWWTAGFSGMIRACGWPLCVLLAAVWLIALLWCVGASSSIARLCSFLQTGERPAREFTLREKARGEELSQAAKSGDAAKTAELLRAGASPAAPDMFGGNALMAAARAGQAHCVSLMLGSPDGAEAARAKDFTRSTALIEAVKGRTSLLTEASSRDGHLECVQILLPASDVHAEDNWKRTALMWAVGDVESVKAILAKDPSAALDANKKGETALMSAAETGDDGLPVVELLLPCSDVMAKDKEGRTALAHAAREARSLPIVKRLAAAIAGRVSDAAGRTPLMELVGDEDTCMMLMIEDEMRKGSNEGSERILAAEDARRARFIEALLPASDLGARDAKGRTASELADCACLPLCAAAIRSAEAATAMASPETRAPLGDASGIPL